MVEINASDSSDSIYCAHVVRAQERERKCHTVRTFGLTAVTKAEEKKDDRNKKEEEEKEKSGKEWVCGKEERDRKRTVREEFETLSTAARKERPMVTGLRETESASAYNLKTYSAFKLLTMAAGYKVLCR